MSLSDLFAEREQYDWMLDTLFEVYKSHPGEEEIAMQYLNVAICYIIQVVSLSDLFAEREQYDLMLDTLFEVYKSHPGEEEIAMQYLNVAICYII